MGTHAVQYDGWSWCVYNRENISVTGGLSVWNNNDTHSDWNTSYSINNVSAIQQQQQLNFTI